MCEHRLDMDQVFEGAVASGTGSNCCNPTQVGTTVSLSEERDGAQRLMPRSTFGFQLNYLQIGFDGVLIGALGCQAFGRVVQGLRRQWFRGDAGHALEDTIK